MALHGMKIVALSALAATLALGAAPAMAGGYERDGYEWSVARGGYESGGYAAEQSDDGYAGDRYEGGYERSYQDRSEGGGYREEHRRGPPPCGFRRERYDDDGCGQVRLSNDFFADQGGVGGFYESGGGGGGGGFVFAGGSAGAGASAFAFASASASARVSVSFHGGFRFHGGHMGHHGCGCGGKH